MSPLISNKNHIAESHRTTLSTLAIQDLRARILQNKCCRKCSPQDLARLRTEDWWLVSFLRNYNYDLDITYAVLVECIQWRINFQVENISILGMKPLLDRRLAYLHGRDLTECSIMWINLAQYRIGDTGFENIFVFWLERHTMDTKADPLTIVIDMTGATMKNMDMNIFKFILHALKYYYPNTVHDIVIFESPPIFNSSWMVVKSWMDSAHPQMHFVTRDTITQFIDSKYLPPHMGGEDTFKFTMDDLAKCLPVESPHQLQNGDLSSEPDRSPERNGLDSLTLKRAVTFDDDDEEANRKAPLTLTRKISNGTAKRGIPQGLKPLVEARLRGPEADWIKNAFLHISPRDVLTLNRLDGMTDYVEVVAVRNTSQSPVMFKIKTTSPEKFRVRPSTGVIPPGSTDIIRVYLQNEYRSSCAREKFLLMALETENNNLETFADLWKKVDSEKKVEQKLRCRINDDVSSEGSNAERFERSSTVSSEVNIDVAIQQQEQIDRLRTQCDQLQTSQRVLTLLILTLLFGLMVILVYERFNYSKLEAAIETLKNKINVTECSAPSAPASNVIEKFMAPFTYEDDL